MKFAELVSTIRFTKPQHSRVEKVPKIHKLVKEHKRLNEEPRKRTKKN